MNLHPKVRAALIAAVLVGVVSVANAVVDAYPTASWVPFLSALIPVLAGYLKSGPAPVHVDPTPVDEGNDANAGAEA